MLDILTTIDTWRESGRQIALATVVSTWGSSPRQPGAKMGIAQPGADEIPPMIGSVSGGCVETAVVGEALETLSDGQPRLLDFGVTDDTAWDVGLACGGKISVWVEPLDAAWWALASDAARHDRRLTTVTPLAWDVAGAKVVLDEGGTLIYASPVLSDALRDDLAAAGRASAHTHRTRIGGLDTFIDVMQPRPRLIIVGGAHVAMALADFAAQLGYVVIIIDPRRAFATPERFPRAALITHDYPDKALPKIGLTADTYIAILTHDPKIDDPALRTALPSPAPYVGILSGRRTHEQRIERLTAAGMDAALLTRVHVPIGLDIGGRTPEEIALAIMAQIVAVRNGVKA
jgi:xanthine dehydrogenase accessory factor